jgi:CxxC-x17-CxxC domain-containing protein
MYVDKVLRCRECGADFAFTAGEQQFFALKGLVNEPGRCPTCRANRRASRDGGVAMDAPYRPPREMHPAICAQCGVETRVPFLPRGDRPIYCSTSFDQVRVR